MAFRLFAVESEAAAATFVYQQYPTLAQKSLAFRPRAAPPKRYSGDEAEALVLVADGTRPGIVYVSSFEEMEAAQSFIRFEEKNGLDLDLVTTYWGSPQPVTKFAASPHVSAAAAAAPSVSAAVQVPVTAPRVQAAAAVSPLIPGRVRQGMPPAPPRKQAPASSAAAAPAQRESIIDSIRNWPGWPTIRARVTAVSLLNSEVYEAIRKDPIAFSQARTIVAAAAAAAGVGALWFGPLAVVSFAIMGVIGWLAGAHLTHWVGTKLFTGRQAEESKVWLFKSLGFCQAPRLLVLLGVLVPGFGLIFALAGFVWTLAASITAVEETLEIDTQSALLSAMTGWLAMFAIAQAAPLMVA
jgi:hypothetical protein